ncbi:unnamed protein product [Lepeophtheirus salmonis]|uniref:(salmon louse) hypothetical protein n=1 Tax=Lepeophtheirus salmonis TaxID=72036 RepID=A0A7R8HAE9_LEPSM|nr:unnamed protein product [Lepeophtheirus salmonis]CAF2970530.1 unnamed protein product [Lepeophtheirus salmonis]
MLAFLSNEDNICVSKVTQGTLEEKKKVTIRESPEYEKSKISSVQELLGSLEEIEAQFRSYFKNKGAEVARKIAEKRNFLENLKDNESNLFATHEDLQNLIDYEVKGRLFRAKQVEIENNIKGKTTLKCLENICHSNNIAAIKLENGSITSDPKKVAQHTGQFYEDLYKCTNCSEDHCCIFYRQWRSEGLLPHDRLNHKTPRISKTLH